VELQMIFIRFGTTLISHRKENEISNRLVAKYIQT
jgi:hypothetical protein